MRELENNNYKPIFQSFLNLLQKRKKLQLERLRKNLNLLKKVSRLLHFLPIHQYKPSKKLFEGEETQYIGEAAEKYLRTFASKSEADTTYGLYEKGGKFYIGNKLAIIVHNDFVVGKDEYEGTPGLWELIVSKEPKDYTDEDKANYAKLMIKTGALHRGNDPENKRPKSSSGYKWKNILKDIWGNRKKYEGSGVIVILSDPNALLERLDLLLASQEAGHTGVGNE